MKLEFSLHKVFCFCLSSFNLFEVAKHITLLHFLLLAHVEYTYPFINLLINQAPWLAILCNLFLFHLVELL